GMRRVVVNIDRLVLKGFRYEDRHAIAQGLQEQLQQMLSEPGMAERLSVAGHIPRLRAGQIEMSPGSKPQQVGIATASEIGERLNR
ncbi:MAG: hypothetical protein HY348_00205, partial [Nitrospira defluvii]|nr:hypothetical protein [Nitrospira defluvii]